MLLHGRVEQLSAISDWPAEKIRRFGAAFVQKCAQFALDNNLRTNCEKSDLAAHVVSFSLYLLFSFGFETLNIV